MKLVKDKSMLLILWISVLWSETSHKHTHRRCHATVGLWPADDAFDLRVLLQLLLPEPPLAVIQPALVLKQDLVGLLLLRVQPSLILLQLTVGHHQTLLQRVDLLLILPHLHTHTRVQIKGEIKYHSLSWRCRSKAADSRSFYITEQHWEYLSHTRLEWISDRRNYVVSANIWLTGFHKIPSKVQTKFTKCFLCCKFQFNSKIRFKIKKIQKTSGPYPLNGLSSVLTSDLF